MFKLSQRATLTGSLISFTTISAVSAHEIVGNRLFPATLAIEDPGVGDELAFPTVSRFKNGNVPAAWQSDVSVEYAKRITEDFAISIGSTWSHINAPGGPNGAGASGFQNIETGLKYRLFKNAEHEFVLSVGIDAEWGRTGSPNVGAESFNVYSPAVYFGKGFGDLPDTVSWLRPFAVTGVVSYDIPSRGFVDGELVPRVLNWGGSLQYSLPYLKSSVVDLGLPEFFNHLVPIVEVALNTPVSNTFDSGTLTTGTVSPGVIWVGQFFQVGIEAMIPINRQSGRGTGVMGQIHFNLDDIDPKGLGKPLFNNGIASRK